MPEFTITQTVIAIFIVLFFALFYIRRFWFWFWKVSKLFKQFEDLERITLSTNQEIKEVHQKLNKLIASNKRDK